MAVARTLPAALDKVLRGKFLQVKDPGASGTLNFTRKGLAVFKIVTATSESRALPDASKYGVGQLVLVSFLTDGGDLSITGSDQTITLEDAGQAVLFVLVDNNGTKAWRVLADSRVSHTELVAATAALGGATLPADTATTTEIPASPDADDAITAFLELTAALVAAGVISDDFTQATS